MKAEDWVSAFAREIGVETPSLEEFDLLLALAAVAARSSNKTAAPAACWVAGRSGQPLGELLAAAERVGSS